MKYRIVKNDDHFAIQEKYWIFFWRVINFGSKNWKDLAIYETLQQAERSLEDILRLDEIKKRKKSKYKVVKTKVLTKLYRTMNKD
jgi:hypothetical protein